MRHALIKAIKYSRVISLEDTHIEGVRLDVVQNSNLTKVSVGFLLTPNQLDRLMQYVVASGQEDK